MNTAQKNSGMIYLHPVIVNNLTLIKKIQNTTGTTAIVQGSFIILKGVTA